MGEIKLSWSGVLLDMRIERHYSNISYLKNGVLQWHTAMNDHGRIFQVITVF